MSLASATLVAALWLSPAVGAARGGDVVAAGSALGTVRAAGSRDPVEGARVLVVPARPDSKPGVVADSNHLDPGKDPPGWIRSAETDETGRFDVPDLDAYRVRIVVLAPGFRRLEYVVDLTQRRRRRIILFVEPDTDAVMRTVVETPQAPPPEQVKSTAVEAEEIRTAPGTQGDPLRALQNLPGVARTPGGFGLLVLRGSAPNQSRVFLGGHALPRAFHSLALASVVPEAAIDRMEFVPSNFGARYGDATGGLVVLDPARLQSERVHGHARLDLLGAGAHATGPIGRGAWLVAAQRGWVDGVLQGVERVDPTQFFTLPRYYNYQAFFEHPTKRGGVVAARVLGAGDRLQARNPGINSRPILVFEMISQFHRADLSFRTERGPWSFWLTPSVRLERNGFVREGAEWKAVRDDAVVSLRAEASRGLTQRVRLMVGADAEVDWYRTHFQRPAFLGSGDPAVDERRTGVSSALGVYTQASIGVGAWTLVPGLRTNAFTLGETGKASVDPRLTAHWRFAPRWHWSMGAGVYSQARIQQSSVDGGFLTSASAVGNVILPASLLSLEPRAGFSPSAGALSVARAAQLSTALGRELGESWYVELAGWGRLRDNADGLFFDEDGAVEAATSTWSTSYGLEALARRRLGPKLWGWVGYTLARVQERVRDPLELDRSPRVWPNAFDQRHNLVAIASYQLPKRWRVGGRFRLVSGSPFTDVAGVVWVPPQQEPLPAPGGRNGARFPVFHQLDLRIDKSWLLQRALVAAYLDVQNVYNRLNPEAFIYSADYSRRVDAVGLPILPSIGVRVEY
ncbi:MAG: TonB-dependent receptor domain-containing protein [Nannocystaceae bacterium]|nr:TonB-dependent receptor [bacterium]